MSHPASSLLIGTGRYGARSVPHVGHANAVPTGVTELGAGTEPATHCCTFADKV